TNEWETFRWSERQASLRLPVDRSGHYAVELSVAVVEPAGRVLDISCDVNERSIPQEFLASNPLVQLECRVTAGELLVSLATEPHDAPAENRELGISIRDVRVTAEDQIGILLTRARMALVVTASLLTVWIGTAVGVQPVHGRSWRVPRPFDRLGVVDLHGLLSAASVVIAGIVW